MHARSSCEFTAAAFLTLRGTVQSCAGARSAALCQLLHVRVLTWMWRSECIVATSSDIGPSQALRSFREKETQKCGMRAKHIYLEVI